MNTDAITQLVLIIDKYKQLEKNSLSSTKSIFAKEVIKDLEVLKEKLKDNK